VTWIFVNVIRIGTELVLNIFSISVNVYKLVFSSLKTILSCKYIQLLNGGLYTNN